MLTNKEKVKIYDTFEKLVYEHVNKKADEIYQDTPKISDDTAYDRAIKQFQDRSDDIGCDAVYYLIELILHEKCYESLSFKNPYKQPKEPKPATLTDQPINGMLKVSV